MTSEQRLEYVRNRKLPFAVLDVVILAVAVIVTVMLAFTVVGDEGFGVEIIYGDTRIVLPLEKDTEQRVGDVLTVVIKNGKCRVSDAKCSNRTCVKTGDISRVGESIICAQFGVVITVIGFDGLAASVGQG